MRLSLTHWRRSPVDPRALAAQAVNVFDVRLAEARRAAALAQVEAAELRRRLACYEDWFLSASRRADAAEREVAVRGDVIVTLTRETDILRTTLTAQCKVLQALQAQLRRPV